MSLEKKGGRRSGARRASLLPMRSLHDSAAVAMPC